MLHQALKETQCPKSIRALAFASTFSAAMVDVCRFCSRHAFGCYEVIEDPWCSNFYSYNVMFFHYIIIPVMGKTGFEYCRNQCRIQWTLLWLTVLCCGYVKCQGFLWLHSLDWLFGSFIMDYVFQIGIHHNLWLLSLNLYTLLKYKHVPYLKIDNFHIIWYFNVLK